MSTNLYAYYKIASDPDVTITIHIAQLTADGATISTAMFPTFDAMATFLEYNAEDIIIKTEAGAEIPVSELREKILGRPRKPLTPYLKTHGFYTDPSGHLAYRGVFS